MALACAARCASRTDAAVLDALGAAADANVDVRNEVPVATAPATGTAPAAAAETAGKGGKRGATGKSRKSPIGVQGAGAQKGKAGKRKKVTVIAGPGGKKVAQADVQVYAAKRRAAAGAETGAGEDAGARTAIAAEEAAATIAENATKEVVPNSMDDSLETEDADMEGDLEEDEHAGGLASAIDVWLTAIRYTAGASAASCHSRFSGPCGSLPATSKRPPPPVANKCWQSICKILLAVLASWVALREISLTWPMRSCAASRSK